jgi:hypothetical protein
MKTMIAEFMTVLGMLALLYVGLWVVPEPIELDPPRFAYEVK